MLHKTLTFMEIWASTCPCRIVKNESCLKDINNQICKTCVLHRFQLKNNTLITVRIQLELVIMEYLCKAPINQLEKMVKLEMLPKN